MSRKYRDAPKSDLDNQRELLDSLMGINRNNDRDEDAIRDFRDDRLCKFYLLGLCPHEMFVNTKMDCGPCPKLHSEALRDEFERTVTGNDLFMFDQQVEREFTSRVNEIDRVIERARGRLEEEKNEEELNPSLNPDVIKIQSELQTLTVDAETAGEEGDIDKAQELMVRIEELNKNKQEIVNKINDQKKAIQQKMGVDVNKKLRVCDVCGSYLSILDSDKRLQDHFMGKQHVGYQVMRDTLAEIKTRKEEQRNKPMDSSRVSDGRDRGSSRERRQSSRDRPARRDSRDRHERPRDRSRDGRRGGNGDNRDSRRRERSRSPPRDKSYRDDSRDRGRRR